MLALLLLEMGLAFSLACAVASPGGLGQLSVAAANQALLAAATVGFTSFLLGQYRPKLFMRTRSLLLNTALGGVVAFPAVWAVLSACGMRGEWLVGPDRVWPTKILLTWLVALFAIRIAMLLAVRSKLFVRRVVVPGEAGCGGPRRRCSPLQPGRLLRDRGTARTRQLARGAARSGHPQCADQPGRVGGDAGTDAGRIRQGEGRAGTGAGLLGTAPEAGRHRPPDARDGSNASTIVRRAGCSR